MRRKKTKREVRLSRAPQNQGKTGWAAKQSAQRRSSRTKHRKFSYGRS